MNLIRKNEILTDIIQNLNKISSSLNKNKEQQAIFNELKKIQEEIKSNIEHDNNWKKFEENFDLVYENYLKRLTETYPNLTVTDKKICAYLKMGLSSKDIAPLLNMSYRSVEMSRYRLRKKMNLDRNVSLSDFLQNFR
jgi:DNA-binding CsgD family transcriptional regulator